MGPSFARLRRASDGKPRRRRAKDVHRSAKARRWTLFSLGRSAFEERSKFAAARRVAQLPQRLGLDLPDPFACDREALTDLFERVLTAVADAEPHLDDLFFARRQRLQHGLGLFLEVQVDHR